MRIIAYAIFLITNLNNIFSKKRKAVNSTFLRNNFLNRHYKKNFIICLPGKSLLKYKNVINQNQSDIIITCNKTNSIIQSQYQLFVNRKRFSTSDINKNKYLLSPKFPRSFIESVLSHQNYEYIPFINFSSNILSNFIYLYKSTIIANNATAVTAAISISILMGAKNIQVYGMDGYKNSDTHFYVETDNKEKEKLLKTQKINEYHYSLLEKIIRKNNGHISKII